MEKKIDLGSYLENAMSRRRLITTATLAGGAALAGASGFTKAMNRFEKLSSAAKLEPTDAYVLCFALNLEYLEAEFYSHAALGAGIEKLGMEVSGRMGGGLTTNGRKVKFSNKHLKNTAKELAYDEQAHVTLIRSVLGDMAPAKPAIDLGALRIGFKNEEEFLQVGRALEDTGVSAYLGAAGLISSKDVLNAAAGILAVEAYHAGNIRLFMAQLNVPSTIIDPKDVLPPISGERYFSNDKSGLAISRTPREVLDIVYGAKDASNGGFFPNGMNLPLPG